MNSLYCLNTNLLKILFVASFASLLFTTAIVILKVKNRKNDLIDLLFEFGMLFYLFYLSLIIGTVHVNLSDFLLLSPGPDLRLILIIPVVSGFVTALTGQKHSRTPVQNGVIAVLLCPCLPFFDGLADFFFAKYLVTIMPGIMALCFSKFSSTSNYISNEITAYSVKEAIDILPDGLLFAMVQGGIISLNPAMKEILYKLDIGVDERADKIWQKLLERPSSRIINRDREVLVKFDDKSYLFQKYYIKLKGQNCMQIHAADVSYEEMLNEKYNAKNLELIDNARRLKAVLSRHEELMEDKWILSCRSHLHDSLSRKVSQIQVLLRSKNPDKKQIKEISKILKNLQQDVFKSAEACSPENTPESFFLRILKTYKNLGIGFEIEGVLPDSEEEAECFALIAGEAFTNAIRHAGAGSFKVVFSEDETRYEMRISNDGTVPDKPIKEGTGLTGIKARVEKLNGKLQIKSDDVFILRVILPRRIT